MSEDYYAETLKARTVTEYGVLFDCEANGCPEPHGDRSLVMVREYLQFHPEDRARRVNGHLVRNVSRVIRYGAWLDES